MGSIGGFDAARLDAGEFQQRVDELEQAAAATAGDLERLAVQSSSLSRARVSSSGASNRVRGVRNSWLMLLKNRVFARSSSASACARSRSYCLARGVGNGCFQVTRNESVKGARFLQRPHGIRARNQDRGQVRIPATGNRQRNGAPRTHIRHPQDPADQRLHIVNGSSGSRRPPLPRAATDRWLLVRSTSAGTVSGTDTSPTVPASLARRLPRSTR